MFGIAFVVILLALGMLFAVKFVLLKPQVDIKKSFTQKELAQNFVSTLLITTIPECENQDITELMEDCASYQGITCMGSYSSCDYLKVVIPDIISKTFDVWKRGYKLTVTKEGRVISGLAFNSTRECIESKPGWGYIPLDVGTVTVRLDIC